MNPTFAKLLVPFLLISVASADEVQEPKSAEHYRLIYQFRPGQTLRYVTVQQATTDAAAAENHKVDKTEAEQRRVFTVDSVDDNSVAHVSMQFEYVRMQMQTDGRAPVVFDTTMKESEIPSVFRMAADSLRGKAPRYEIRANGSVSESAATEAKPAEAKPAEAASTDTVAAAVDPPVRKADEAKPEAFSFLPPLPDQPVQIGESWRQVHTVRVRVTKDISREIEILQTFRLKSVTDGIAEIALNSSITSPVRSPLIRAQLIQASPKGTWYFDIANGRMIRREMHFDQSVLDAFGENTMLSSYGTYREVLQPADTVNPTDTVTPASATSTEDSTAVTQAKGTSPSPETKSVESPTENRVEKPDGPPETTIP